MPLDIHPTAWHAASPEEALDGLAAAPGGLAEADAAERLRSHGPNSLPEAARRPAWRRLVAQFDNVLILVLLAAGVVTLLLGHWVDAGVIFGVVLINALIGFIQEGKAEKALDSIRTMLSPEAVVLRDGRRRRIKAVEVVPGDVVVIEPGDRIPADLRLLRARGLRVQEAALTGESLPVDKAAAPVAADTPLAERTSLAFAGTTAVQGHGEGVVVATGAATEIGRISQMLSTVETLDTPLLRQLAAFGRLLTGAILAVATLAFVIGVVGRGYSMAAMFLAAVGLAVAAIPEGLPAVVTITLAIGVKRMAGRNAIIRRLPAVETLGSVSVICSDKTGTLTRNEMTLAACALADGEVAVEGVGYGPEGTFRRDGAGLDDPMADPLLARLLVAGCVCADALVDQRDGRWTITGDPTEAALVVGAGKAGLAPETLRREHRRLDAIPFESEHAYMATLDADPDGGRPNIHVKGAPEVIFALCDREARANAADAPFDAAAWRARVESLSRRGMRVLALAERAGAPDELRLRQADFDGSLTLIGLVGLLDPPREETVAAVHRCLRAGVRVKMITGDHALTAAAIGERLGLPGAAGALTGREVDGLDDAALRTVVQEVDVFARATPEHKLRLVQALQADGSVVAMTGDGVNDAPALKRADVGVAMGVQGTDAAKEAAEMVLADDNFASIAAAVEEGRTVYDNIKKAILFILPTNGGQALTILAAIAAGMVLPITAVQILWVNMITAVTLALALAFEPAERTVMTRPPRRAAEPLLSGFLLWRVGFVSVLMLLAVFGLFVWEIRTQGTDLATARTAAVNMLVAVEILYLFSARYLTASALTAEGLFGSRPVLIAVALTIVAQAAFTYLPALNVLFGTAPLEPRHWLLIVCLAVPAFLAVEAEKALLRRRGG
ncbi:HAD-IC family P-type ATPase [Caenispirillum bisanense]|uniref:ATPase, P-type (Transporting), HAD superfamily, subfamily IC n=1 Tax=Caenispirillum bisanense TaxID=414052 RepID=A0A286GLL6_9PROT|nr:HAD-IC family P-type ATPase [Caenispirillum bisanense]SOD96408.1 ATPase, P-type (transporting), HAD superfamily, subfamily IC [Caenispirillum bisanense]